MANRKEFEIDPELLKEFLEKHNSEKKGTPSAEVVEEDAAEEIEEVSDVEE